MTKSLRLSVTTVLITAALTPLLFSGPAEAVQVQGPGGLLERGMQNLREENYEEAAGDFSAARDLDPSSTVAAYLLGFVCKKIEDYDCARDNLEDALKLSPAVREAVVKLIDLYYILGKLDLALQMVGVAETEGIKPPETAFLKGLVLMKLGRFDEAVESFAGAKSLNPALSQSADYQIGTARLLTGRLDEARAAFKETVLVDPNSNLAQFSRHYMKTLERRIREDRPLKFAAGVSVLYDDNVLLKPGDTTVAGGVTGEGDAALVTTFSGEFTRPPNGGAGLTALYSLHMTDYQELSSHDFISNTISISPTYGFSGSSVGLTARYNHILVDDASYLQALTIQPAWSVALGPGQFARASLRYQRKEFMTPPLNADEDRDSDTIGAGAEWFLFFGPRRGFFTARYAFDVGDTDGSNWRYYGSTLGADISWPLTQRLRLHLGGEAELQNFTRTHTVFGKTRKDRTYVLNTLAAYAIGERFELTCQYTFIRGDSNLAIFDYDKYTVSGGMEITF
ncbi:MAG: tetratricopeptide repeat protein [Thermodesulfobacteriota bacterium]